MIDQTRSATIARVGIRADCIARITTDRPRKLEGIGRTSFGYAVTEFRRIAKTRRGPARRPRRIWRVGWAARRNPVAEFAHVTEMVPYTAQRASRLERISWAEGHAVAEFRRVAWATRRAALGPGGFKHVRRARLR